MPAIPSTRHLWAALLALGALSGPPAVAEAPPDPLDVWLLTVGPGDRLFQRFGHNALRIQDHQRGTDHVYNFGTFNLAEPGALTGVIQGAMIYRLSRVDLPESLRRYRAANRELTASLLHLTPAQEQALLAFLEENLQPHNQRYRYDYFWDNCSTRVRDALDRVTSGALSRASRGPATATWRQHILRLTSDAPLLAVVMHTLLGPSADAPRTRWQEAFLPEVLHQQLQSLGWVRQEQLLLATTRAPPPPRGDPPRWPAAVGAVLGVLLVRFGARRTPSRVETAAVAALGILTGGMGTLMLLGWLLTGHHPLVGNENLLVLPPWALLLVPAANRPRWLLPVALSLVLPSLVALLLNITGASCQENTTLVLGLAATWWGLAGGAWWRTRHPRR